MPPSRPPVALGTLQLLDGAVMKGKCCAIPPASMVAIDTLAASLRDTAAFDAAFNWLLRFTTAVTIEPPPSRVFMSLVESPPGCLHGAPSDVLLIEVVMVVWLYEKLTGT
jgi:hypothetical protein